MTLRFLRHLDDAVNIMAMIGIVIVLVYQVVMRYIFNNSSPWSAEVLVILFAVIIFFGGASLLKRTSHMGIWLYDSLTLRKQVFIRMASELASLVFYVVILVGSVELARIGRLSATPVLDINRSYIFSIVTAASGLMTVFTLFRMYLLIRGRAPRWLLLGDGQA